jgi:signal transduction histidine kinase
MFAREKKRTSRFRVLAKGFKARGNEIRLAFIFLGLIILPSGLLAYFSWRAMESEKLLSQQRLQESYRQFARLAGREIDSELAKAEGRWKAAVEGIFAPTGRIPAVEKLDSLRKNEPLIAACFLLTGSGRIVYPSGFSLQQENLLPAPWENESYVREREIFETLVADGEALEYRAFDLPGAIAVYGEILSRVSNPQLRGMVESYIGRAQQKKGAWAAALATFQNLLAGYAEVRDLNKMYLRFLAQYQIAVCLENLGRDAEAVAALVRFNRDLMDRSDAVSTQQYSYFLEQIQILATRLLASPKLSERAGYRPQFEALAEQNKKRLSQKYFLQLLSEELSEVLIKRRHYRPATRYMAVQAENEPYLLAYRFLPDASSGYIAGLFAVQIDLAQLRRQLFPAILPNLKFSEQVTMAIRNAEGDFVIGAAGASREPIAVQALTPPFDFWQVAVYLAEAQTLGRRPDFRSTLGLWLISLLLFSILLGAYIFIRRARREAYLSQMKSTFVSNVSHELRTPLASIKMLVELLEMQLAPPAESFKTRAAQYLGIIRRECDRLGRLIENVLDFAKIERGVKQYNFEYEDPAAVLRLAVESFRPHAEAQGFALALDVAEPLPELRLDADAISQVMLNLLSNAAKYSDAVKEIRVRAYRDGSQVVVEITDRGIGIAAAEIPKIFEGFYRVDQRLNAQQQGGMGLGLALARDIVRAHGGDISVNSEAGAGSTFAFTLPIPAEDPAKIKATAPMNGESEAIAQTPDHLAAEIKTP